jgi:hypothetical protein
MATTTLSPKIAGVIRVAALGVLVAVSSGLACEVVISSTMASVTREPDRG